METERCPFCSFSPTSQSDYCEKHRAAPSGAAPAETRTRKPRVCCVCGGPDAGYMIEEMEAGEFCRHCFEDLRRHFTDPLADLSARIEALPASFTRQSEMAKDIGMLDTASTLAYAAGAVLALGADTTGSWHTAALLPDRVRQAIRDRHQAGESAESLAEDYDVPAAFVEHLVSWQLGADTAAETKE